MGRASHPFKMKTLILFASFFIALAAVATDLNPKPKAKAPVVSHKPVVGPQVKPPAPPAPLPPKHHYESTCDECGKVASATKVQSNGGRSLPDGRIAREEHVAFKCKCGNQWSVLLPEKILKPHTARVVPDKPKWFERKK